eukprot:5981638-Pyramimonas_sp.AAC.1
MRCCRRPSPGPRRRSDVLPGSRAELHRTYVHQPAGDRVYPHAHCLCRCYLETATPRCCRGLSGRTTWTDRVESSQA